MSGQHGFDGKVVTDRGTPEGPGNRFIDLGMATGAEVTVESSYDERDLALYALGLGAGGDPVSDESLAQVYEGHPRFAALPTWAVMPSSNVLIAAMVAGRNVLPGLNYGLDRLLHGEQYTEIRAPLPRRARLRHRFRLKAAYDKNPHAVTVVAISTIDDAGRELAYNEFTSFVRGAGGWGGDRGPSGEANAAPLRAPDRIVEERTSPGQALLYRLSGDRNPLHVDPAFAKQFGFDRPILHGLCTYGIVGRQVLAAFCDHDPRRFRSIRVRFAEPVFPGETLVTRMWRESPTRVAFETSVKERDKIVIRSAAVELQDVR